MNAIRSYLRHLAVQFPFIAWLGALSILTVGLLVLDLSLTGGQYDASVVRRATHRVAPAVEKMQAVRKLNGIQVEVKRVSKRTIQETVQTTPPAARPVVEYEKARCGDKLVLLKEECDDGNVTNGDGCSSVCKVESGYSCTKSQPSTCRSSCGDGLIASGKEMCDDVNSENSDGCSQYCQVEPGYTCTGTPSTCTAID